MGKRGREKVPSHLAAVWKPRGQSSHLSSVIKKKPHWDLHDCAHFLLFPPAVSKETGGGRRGCRSSGREWDLVLS